MIITTEHKGHHIASYSSILVPDYRSRCSIDKSIMQILLLLRNQRSTGGHKIEVMN
jgi:hypothetical protein